MRSGEKLPKSLEEMQAFIQQKRIDAEAKMLEQTKEQLGLSDIEWSLVKPRFLKVTMQQKEVSGVVDRPGLSIGPGQLQANPDTPTGNAVYDAKQQLRNLAKDATASSDDIKKQINALRKAQETAQQKLSVARQELRSLLTVRQEAYLITTGVLD
jgi:chaperonin cofactor prefoldin